MIRGSLAPIVVVGLLGGACREGAPPPAASPPPPKSGDLVPAGESVSGTVTVAAGLAGRVQPTDVLYLIARNPKTNGVVAVRREEGVRLPFAFRLTAEDVMMEGAAFAGGPFDLTARLSKTGDAIAGKGDLEGGVRGVAAGSSGIAITLDSVRQ